jgi:ketosteroid isomerase-like protein
MKIRLLLALAGLAIGIITTTFCPTQKETFDLEIARQRDIHGDAKALAEFGEFTQKRDEALINRDAAALAALFTEDALLVAPDGIFSDRPAIEKRYADTFQRSPSTIFSDPRDYALRAVDNAVWSEGEWSSTLQDEIGIVFVRGYWTAIYVREGDAWKIRLLTLSEHPRPAATPPHTASPSSQ